MTPGHGIWTEQPDEKKPFVKNADLMVQEKSALLIEDHKHTPFRGNSHQWELMIHSG